MSSEHLQAVAYSREYIEAVKKLYEKDGASLIKALNASTTLGAQLPFFLQLLPACVRSAKAA